VLVWIGIHLTHVWQVAVRRLRQICLDKFKKLNLAKDDVKRQEKAVQVSQSVGTCNVILI
jgi:hypothetical protein